MQLRATSTSLSSRDKVTVFSAPSVESKVLWELTPLCQLNMLHVIERFSGATTSGVA